MRRDLLQTMIGERCGRLTVVAVERSATAYRTYRLRCRCDCGNEVTTRPHQIATAAKKSCGCLRTTHGMSQTREHRAWSALRARCDNPNDPTHPYIGERGLTYTDRWNPARGGGFENFLADLGPVPGPEYFLGRFDHDRGYFPDNCFWARGSKRREKNYERDGESRTARQWSEHWNVSLDAARKRLAITQ